MDNQAAKADCAAYFDRSAPRYGTVMPFFDLAARDLVAHGAPQPGERLLDVGCGRGAALVPAAEMVGPSGSVIGIDLAPTMVKLTSERVASLGLSHVEVRLGDAENPNFPDASFDVVQASLVLFFLPDLEFALRRYVELLRPRGRLVASTFVDNDRARWNPVQQVVHGFVPAGPPAQRQISTDPLGWSDHLVELLTKVGYVDIEYVEHRYDIVFDDPEHWWAWAESLGYRTPIEQIPAERLPDVKRAALDALEEIRDAGRIVWSPVIRDIRAVATGNPA